MNSIQMLLINVLEKNFNKGFDYLGFNFNFVAVAMSFLFGNKGYKKNDD
jgi:hypothetical protein